MKKQIMVILVVLVLILTGCWSNQELDDSVLVHGVGIEKDESGDKLRTIVELIKPTGQTGDSGAEEAQSGKESGQSIVLENSNGTLLEAARSFIQYAKRRLNFSHSMVWIIGRDLAETKGFIQALDTLRRDQMIRLNSFLFISAEDSDPREILNTPTLYEELTSTELVSALQQTQFNMEYTAIKIREFYALLEEPINSAYIPIIKTEQTGEQTITAIDGTAVIYDNQMVGKLDQDETTGLQWLLNHVRGGTVSVPMEQEFRKVGIEILDTNTTITPQLKGRQLSAEIHTEVEGTLADNMTDRNIDEAFFNEAEKRISEDIKQTIERAIATLQDIKADITGIGVKLYQTDSEKWNAVASDWHDDVFPNADISVRVDTNFTHQGLLNESIEHDHDKPHNNPYQLKE